MSRTWGEVMPPLKPSTEDLAFFHQTASAFLQDKTDPRILILGVTQASTTSLGPKNPS
jgi:hypothetical protein